MTVKCRCGYGPRGMDDVIRHLKLMATKRGEGHTIDVSEWRVQVALHDISITQMRYNARQTR